MPGGASLIIAAGAELITTSTIGFLPKIAGITPPTINNSIIQQGLDGAVNFIQVGATATSAAAATETLRTKSGIISEGLGVDTLVIGRGASTGAAATIRGIAIGTLANAGNSGAIAIGYNVSTGVTADAIAIGNGPALVATGGVVIGAGAYGQGVAGGAVIISIGNLANAQCNAAGVSMAIGNSAVAREGDTVIGNSATSNIQSAFGNRNTVVGAFAGANIAQGHAVAIGASASASQINAIVIGDSAFTVTPHTIVIGQASGNTAPGTYAIIVGQAAGSNHAANIIIGHGGASFTANALMLGGTNSDIRTVVIGSVNTAVTPAARTFRWTNASGVSNAAGNVTWQAPLSTGAAVAASHVFQVGVPHVADAVLQTPATILTLGATATTQFADFGTTLAMIATVIGAAGGFSLKNSANTRNNLYVNDAGTRVDLTDGTNITRIMWNAAASGALPIASQYGGSANVALCSTGGAVGTLQGLYYYNGVDYGAAAEVAATAAGAKSVLKLMRDGGTVTINDGVVGTASALHVKGSAYGAGVASVRLDGLTTGAAAAAGTLLNAPVAGNPTFWIPINIAGVVKYIPAW